ncbi:glycine-rich domain-containing protein [Thermomonospora amylolytica]|uniref:hypothetical protein n=1 Tax=Thermomonospora amylolytica TaxID=1411117 RepID=UPI000E6CC716|nr:hypothetical protein [Thermomonospora amylolytica]
MTVLADRPTQATAKDPRELVPASAWDLLVEDFRKTHHASHAYTDRAVGQFLVFLKAVGNILRVARQDPDAYVRIVPTPPVDEVWHTALQRTELYLPLSLAFAGGMIHHRPVMDDDIRSGAALARTIPHLEATGLFVDAEFWNDEAASSCCPPECAGQGGLVGLQGWEGYGLASDTPLTISF